MARDSRVDEHCHRAEYANGYLLHCETRSQEAGLACARLRCMQQLNRVRSFPTWRTAHEERAHDGRLTTSTTRHLVND